MVVAGEPFQGAPRVVAALLRCRVEADEPRRVGIGEPLHELRRRIVDQRARIAHDDAALAPLSLAVVPDHRRRNLPRERLAVARRIVEHRTHRQVGPIQRRRFLAVLAQERPVDAATGRR